MSQFVRRVVYVPWSSAASRRPAIRATASIVVLLFALLCLGISLPLPDHEIAGNREVSELEFRGAGGRALRAVLSMPRGEGPFPVIVTIHGGNQEKSYGYLRTMATPTEGNPTVALLNEQPWAILAITYRAGFFGLEEEDVVAGIRFAMTLPRVDPSRVGVLGGSHGGHLVLRAAALMGKEFLAAAAGSPWMTDPFVYMQGDADGPPLSLVPSQALKGIQDNGRQLYQGLVRRTGSDAAAQELMLEHSIEAHAELILVPVLFLTSLGDAQVPHVLVQPLIDRLVALDRDITVYTATESPHGFYWGREQSAARVGPKTTAQEAEEERARHEIVSFFARQFGRLPLDDTPVPGAGDVRGSTASGFTADVLRQAAAKFPAMPTDTATLAGGVRSCSVHSPKVPLQRHFSPCTVSTTWRCRRGQILFRA